MPEDGYIQWDRLQDPKSKLMVWIDDDPYPFQDLVQFLKDEGYNLLVFQSVVEALDHLQIIRTCELILLDLSLPFRPPARTELQRLRDGRPPEWYSHKYLGKELLRYLRTDAEVKTPVVILSAFAEWPQVVTSADLKELRAVAVPKSKGRHAVQVVVASQMNST